MYRIVRMIVVVVLGVTAFVGAPPAANADVYYETFHKTSDIGFNCES
jgi:hypothetical protein